MEQQEVKDGDVYNVRTFRDELLVEKEVLSIEQLKDGAKDFLIATGTGLLHPERPNVVLGDDNMKYPERQWVRKAELVVLGRPCRRPGQARRKGAGEAEGHRALWQRLSRAGFGADHQTDRNTSYNLYLQVQNELEAAVNELRDELALAKFNESTSLEERYGRTKEASLLDKIKAAPRVPPADLDGAPRRKPRILLMGKFKNKKREMGAISTASLPDIVFMLSSSWSRPYCGRRRRWSA